MFDIFTIALIITIIIFTIGLIYKRMRDYRKVEIQKLVSLGKVNVLKNGFIFNLVIFLVYLGIFIYKSNKVYQILNQEYLENIFQLFNINHLELLMTYFYEQEMLSKYFRVNQFRHEFLFLLVTIVAEFCMFTYRFYLTKVENLIYSNGLLLNGKLIPWDTIKSYEWEEQKGLFNNKKIKRLTIMSNSKISFTFERKQSIDVTEETKRIIDHYLERYKIESKNLA